MGMETCAYCSTLLSAARRKRRAKFCSDKCRNAHRAARRREHVKLLGLPPSTVRTVAELLVLRDLLARGCEVYRAVSVAGTCDFVTLQGGAVQRVAVHTGYRRPTGTVQYPRNKEAADYHAVVVDGTDVIWLPEEPTL